MLELDERTPTRSPRSTASTTRPACSPSWPRSSSGASASPRRPTSRRAVPPPRRLYADALDEPDEAVECYHDRPRDRLARDARALEALERIYFQREQWTELFGIYEKMVDIAAGRRRRGRLLRAHGQDRLRRARRPRAGPVDLWNRVLDLRGEDPTALWALGDLYEAAEQWRELVDVLERQVAHHQRAAATRSRCYKRLGRIWGEKLERERNALEAWQKVLEIDPATSRRCRPSPTSTAHPGVGGAGRDAAPAHRDRRHHRLDDDGAARAGTRSSASCRARSCCARRRPSTPGARCSSSTRATSAALGALEGLFTQEARWEECVEVLERKAQVLEKPDGQDRRAAPGRGHLAGQDRRRRPRPRGVYERILQLDAGQPGAPPSSSRRSTARTGQWEKLIELLLARVEFITDKQQKVETAQASPRSTSRSSGSRSRPSSCSRPRSARTTPTTSSPRSSSGSPPRPPSGTSCSPSTPQSSRPSPTRRPRADLWVKIGRWYGDELGHLDYAIASEQQALALDPEPLGALERAGRLLPQDAQVGRAGRDARPARRARGGAREEGRAASSPWPSCRGRSSRDPEQAIAPYRSAARRRRALPRRPDALERLYRRLAAVGRAHRRAHAAQGRDHRGHRPGRRAAAPDRRALRGAARRRARRPSRPTRSSSPSIRRTCRRCKALEPLYERTGAMQDVPRVLEQQLDVTGPTRSGSRSTSAWPPPGRSTSASPTAPGGLEKILLIDDRARADLPRPRAALPAGAAAARSWSRPAAPHQRDQRRRRARRALRADGAGLRGGAAATTTAPSRPTTTSSPSTPTTSRRSTPWPALRADRGLGPGRRRDAPARASSSTTRPTRVELLPPHGRASTTSSWATPSAEERYQQALSLDPAPRADDGVA